MKVPHIQSLGFQLQDGSMIHVQGIIPHSANRFHINLSVAPALNTKCETAFHLNPRFEGTNQVVRNSYLAGRWGGEERGGGFPLSKGSSFECIILCTAKEYRVAFNGAHFCTFSHRTAPSRVRHVVVEGDITLNSVHFSGNGYAPQPTLPPAPASHMPGDNQPPPYSAGYGPPQPGYGPPQPGYGPPQPGYGLPQPGYGMPQPGYGMPQPGYGMPQPGYAAPQPGYAAPQPGYSQPGPPQVLTVPMKRNMASGLYPGSVITVCGTPSNKFTINLSMNNAPNTDIALHFDVRFDQNVVVRNTFRNGRWEHEERQQPIMPFQRGVPFNIMILCEQHAFKISVNNVHFVEYSHRIKNLHDIKWLDILGELTLSDVRTP